MSLKNNKLQMSLKNSLNLNYFGGVCSKQKKSCEYLNFLWLSSAYLLWVIEAKYVVIASCISVSSKCYTKASNIRPEFSKIYIKSATFFAFVVFTTAVLHIF